MLASEETALTGLPACLSQLRLPKCISVRPSNEMPAKEWSRVAPVIVNAPVSVNVDNSGRYRSRYCKRVYKNGAVIVDVDSNGSDLSRYCQRLH